MQLRPVSCQSYIPWGLETSEFSLSDNWWRGWRHGFCHCPRDLSSGSHVKSLELYHTLKIWALRRSDRTDWLLKLPSQLNWWEALLRTYNGEWLLNIPDVNTLGLHMHLCTSTLTRIHTYVPTHMHILTAHTWQWKKKNFFAFFFVLVLSSILSR